MAHLTPLFRVQPVLGWVPMDPRLLIDNIVRQTTVLIAELATAAGVRAPLAHVADQVFLQLSREIESQGIGRKVAADMFGLALRTYQRKVQRLTETESSRQRTLWEAVLAFIAEAPATRARLRERFRYEDEDDLGAVLNDLIASGLLMHSGRGEATVYATATPEERELVEGRHHLEAVTHMVWHHVFSVGPRSAQEVSSAMSISLEDAANAIAWLEREGRLGRWEGEKYRALSFALGLDGVQGWEAAVFDHFSAMAQAIVRKVKLRRADGLDVVGGSTYTFNIYPGHPNYNRVMALLENTRREVRTLWQDTTDYNGAHPRGGGSKVKVRFYFGQDVLQTVEAGDDEVEQNPGSQGDNGHASE
jgi:hypothetical protein